MDLKELRKKTKQEITKELEKARAEMEKLAQEVLKGKEKNVVKVRNARKDCARIATVLQEVGDKNE